LERINQEIKRCSHVVRISTDEACCLRFVRALAPEIHEEWIDSNRYINMEPLREALKRPAPNVAA
jgi:putative transposase